MKPLNYTLAAVLGALFAMLATQRTAGPAAGVAPLAAPAPAALRPVATASASVADAAATAELERLAKENAELRTQLDDARARLREHDATLLQTKAQLDELRRPMDADILSSALRADLKSGEVVVTGGYKLPDGRRLYAFAKPVIRQVDGADMVKIEGRYLSLTDEAGRSVGLDNLATNAANTLQHGEVWVPGEEESVMARLEGTAGTDMLTYPSILVKPGSSGSISIGDIRLKVTPTLTAESGGLGMELRLEQPQSPAPAAAPAAAGQ